jgi:hypothetical protein
MVIFFEFPDKAARARVLQSIADFGFVESSCDGGLSVWFETYGNDSLDNAIERLDEQGDLYELV